MLPLIAWMLLGARPAPAPVPFAPEDPGGSLRERPSAPVCAIDAEGSVLLAWESRGEGEPDIRFNRRAPELGAGWLAEPRRVDTDAPGASRSLEPRIAAGPPGVVYVAWQDARDGADDIRFNRSTDGGRSWGARDLRLDDDAPGAATSSMPSLAADGDGRVWAAWEDLRSGDRDIFFARSTDAGRTFGPDVRLDSDEAGRGVSYHPRILARPDGTVLVYWWDERDGLPDIYVRRSTDGGASWGDAEVRLDPGEPGAASSRHVRMAAGTGWIAAAWEEPDGVLVRISRDEGASWETPLLVPPVPARGFVGLRDPVPLAVGARLFVAAVPLASDGEALADVWWFREIGGKEGDGERAGDGRLLPGGAASAGPGWIGSSAGEIWTTTWGLEQGLRIRSFGPDGAAAEAFLAEGSAGHAVTGLTGASLPRGVFVAWVRQGEDGGALLQAGRIPPR